MGGQRTQVIEERDDRTAAGTAVAEGPPPELVFKRRLRPAQTARDLWAARELVRALAERDLRARYKQAVLGFAWAVLTPLMLMCGLHARLPAGAVKIDTGGVPYPLFSYVGLLAVDVLLQLGRTRAALSLANNLPPAQQGLLPARGLPAGRP